MPRKKIDPKQIEAMAGIGCTQTEMAYVLGVSIAEFERRLRDPKLRNAIEKGAANFKVEIRSAQRKLAKGGNAAMLIWLGKQVLGQRDYQRIEQISATIEAPGGNRITVEYVDQLPERRQIDETAHFAD